MIKGKGVHLLDQWLVHNKLVLNFSCYHIFHFTSVTMQAWDNLFNYQQTLCRHTINFQRVEVVMALFAKMSLTLDSGAVKLCQKVTSDLLIHWIYLSCLVQRCYSYYELHKKLIPNICSDDKLSTYNCAAALCSWLSKSVEFYMFFFLVFLAKFSRSHVSFIRSFILIRGKEKWGNSSHIRMHFLWDNIYAMKSAMKIHWNVARNEVLCKQFKGRTLSPSKLNSLLSKKSSV